MTAPTLYFLKITERIVGDYEIWESHMCQEKGCFQTEPQFVTLARNEDEAKAIIHDWRVNPPLNGQLQEVEWEHRPRLPEIHEDNVRDDFCGTYSDVYDMVIAICELSNIKAYTVVDDDGRALRYTFEVVE